MRADTDQALTALQDTLIISFASSTLNALDQREKYNDVTMSKEMRRLHREMRRFWANTAQSARDGK